MRKLLVGAICLYSGALSAAEVQPIFQRNTSTNLLSVLNGSGTFTPIGTIANGVYTLGGPNYFWTDTTSEDHNIYKYYTGVNGTPTSATLAKFNRIFCGTATAISGEYPAVPVSWVSALWNNWEVAGQFVCTSALGNGAAMLASRTSDYRLSAGTWSPGSAGFNALGFNDDETVGGTPIALAGLAFGIRNSAAVKGTTLAFQLDVVNWGDVVDATPYDGAGALGNTTVVLMTPGAREIAGKTRSNPTAGFRFHGHDGIAFRKGFIVNATALDPTVGNAGNGTFIEMAPLQEYAWRNSSNALIAELWGHSTNGIQVSPKLTVSGTINIVSNPPSISDCGTTPSVTSTSTSNSGVFTMGTGTPSSCTLTFSTAFTTTANCVITPRNSAALGTNASLVSTATGMVVTLATGTDSAQYNYVCLGST